MRARFGADQLPGVQENVCASELAGNHRGISRGQNELANAYAAGQEQAAISATGSRSQTPSRRIFVPEGYLKI